ncbi:MAG: TraR/DksA family transcriptional regulator [Sedimentisphaerales bacterium]|nr:TraR/DksA family transcriptional regulator [Sedimentisphaerales bacterium]
MANKSAKPATEKKGKTAGGNGKMSAKQLGHFQKLLLDKRRELVGDVNGIHDEALKSSRSDASGDLSSMPIHMADIGTDNYDQELALNLMDGERKLLKQIDEALDRISDGTYGICQGTGKPISKTRLEALPWARCSHEYAERIEKGLVQGEPQ